MTAEVPPEAPLRRGGEPDAQAAWAGGLAPFLYPAHPVREGSAGVAPPKKDEIVVICCLCVSHGLTLDSVFAGTHKYSRCEQCMTLHRLQRHTWHTTSNRTR